MEIIKSNTIKRRETKNWNTYCNVVCLLKKGVVILVNTVTHEKQKPLGLYAVNVDFPLPFVMDAYLFKKTIFFKTDTNPRLQDVSLVIYCK